MVNISTPLIYEGILLIATKPEIKISGSAKK